MPGNIVSAGVIQAWLIAKLSERLEIEPGEIDAGELFASYGLGSTEAVSLTGELAEWLGRKLSPALVYEYPTIESLARYLAGAPNPSKMAPESDVVQDIGNEPVAI